MAEIDVEARLFDSYSSQLGWRLYIDHVLNTIRAL